MRVSYFVLPDASLDAEGNCRNLTSVPTILPFSPKAVSRKSRAAAKRRITRKGPSFGAAVKKYARIVRSGIGNLSTREGFGD